MRARRLWWMDGAPPRPWNVAAQRRHAFRHRLRRGWLPGGAAHRRRRRHGGGTLPRTLADLSGHLPGRGPAYHGFAVSQSGPRRDVPAPGAGGGIGEWRAGESDRCRIERVLFRFYRRGSRTSLPHRVDGQLGDCPSGPTYGPTLPSSRQGTRNRSPRISRAGP